MLCQVWNGAVWGMECSLVWGARWCGVVWSGIVRNVV